MRDENAEPEEPKESAPANAGQESPQAKPTENITNEAEKDAASKPISQGQLLWVAGAAKADAAMDDEDEDQGEQSSDCHANIDPELKRKC